MHIVVATKGYPYKDDPEFSFVGELVRTFGALGHDCDVIVPQSITKRLVRGKDPRPTFWKDQVVGRGEVRVHQPYYVSLSSFPLSDALWEKAVISELRKIDTSDAILYGHFWQAAIALSKFAENTSNIVVVATGESSIPEKTAHYSRLLKNRVDIVIAVSTKNKNESIELNLCDRNSVVVLPNAVSDAFFDHPDKYESRKLLGLPSEEFIALFVGHFSERKGSLRADEALTKAGGVCSVFLGAGDLPPKGNHCLRACRVSHEELPIYLSASDVFVLPTLAEGCCNAIVEALAVGVPVISSNLEFNFDILNEQNSILVDPLDVDSLASAIKTIRDDASRREAMANAAKSGALGYKLENRALKILDSINAVQCGSLEGCER